MLFRSLVHSVASGVHVGTTLKAMGVETAREAAHRFDADLGALVVHRAVRVGATVRNVLQPTVGSTGVRLPRQIRVGGAWDGQIEGVGPLVVAVDADLSKYDLGGRERRMVAVGAERWTGGRRVGLRAGGRVNTVGRHDAVLAAGASVALTSLVYVEGEVTRGGAVVDRGWSVGARVAF